MGKRLFREIEAGENIEECLAYIESICRVRKSKNGKCRRAYGKNYYFAVLKWNLYNPKDPVLKGSDYVVHHINLNSMNDDLNNLEKKLSSTHNRDHRKGKRLSAETIAKKSAVMKGENNPNYGKHRSQKTKDKISASNKGKKISLETKAKISAAKKGKKTSLETRAKLSAVKFKPVMANFIKFASVKEATRVLGVNPKTIRRRILAKKPGYYYI